MSIYLYSMYNPCFFKIYACILIPLWIMNSDDQLDLNKRDRILPSSTGNKWENKVTLGIVDAVGFFIFCIKDMCLKFFSNLTSLFWTMIFGNHKDDRTIFDDKYHILLPKRFVTVNLTNSFILLRPIYV